MRIATFNLESLGHRGSEDGSLEERIAVLRPQLVRLGADVLCLQEVNGQHRKGAPHRCLEALDALVAGTPYAGFDRVATSGPGGAGVADVHNLVTLSRFPIREHREIRNSYVPALRYQLVSACPPAPEPIEISLERPVLLSRIAVGERTLGLFNVHFRAPLAAPVPGQKEAPFVWRSVSGWAEGYFIASLKRAAQALEVRLAIDALMDADPSGLIAVTGDFNARDHETPLKILVGAEEDTGNGRLAVRSLAVLDRSLAEDRRFSVLHHGRPEMLDHVLVSRSLLAHFRMIEVHNETLGDEIVAFGRTLHQRASYHAPVVAEFDLPG
jgi:endonuclease/exonuclease/phosphatase family metal-dependent hydrolase